MAGKKRVVYSVEEYVDDDNSCSTEFKKLKDAKEHAKRLATGSGLGYGTKKIRIWKAELVSSKDV